MAENPTQEGKTLSRDQVIDLCSKCYNTDYFTVTLTICGMDNQTAKPFTGKFTVSGDDKEIRDFFNMYAATLIAKRMLDWNASQPKDTDK